MRALLLLALFSRRLAAVRACRGGGFAAAAVRRNKLYCGAGQTSAIFLCEGRAVERGRKSEKGRKSGKGGSGRSERA